MADQQIYVGGWTDHTYNAVIGAKFTISSSWGSQLIAALAVLVTITGTCCWKIAAFSIHQYRSRGTQAHEKVDGFDLMIQTLLRNSGSADSAVLEFLQLGNGWKTRKIAARRRAFIWALVPLAFFLFFTAAGVFSGLVANKVWEASLALVNEGNCGTAQVPSSLSGQFTATVDLQGKVLNDSRAARVYSATCYHAPPGSIGCTTFPKQSLKYKIQAEAPCQFPDPSWCYPSTASAYTVDTGSPDDGMLDSHDDLGINAKPADRVKFRVRTTCAVVNFGPSSIEELPDPATGGATNVRNFLFGPISNITDYTYSFPEILRLETAAYQLQPVYYRSYNTTDNVWMPIPELLVPESDLTLLFLSQSGIAYTAPVLDPLFTATTPSNESNTYLADFAVEVLECAEQFQFCNPTTNSCTTLSGSLSVLDQARAIGFNTQQTATVYRLQLALAQAGIYNIIEGQGAAALQANDLVQFHFSPGLPDTQWQTEVTRWAETNLAKIQQSILDFPANPWYDPSSGTSLVVIPASATDDNNTNGAFAAQCGQQLVQSSADYQTFSTLGVGIICGFAVLSIVLALSLESCVNCVARREKSKKRYKKAAWIADGKYQLLRMALEGVGFGPWGNTDKPVPYLDQPKEGQEIFYPAQEMTDESGVKAVRFAPPSKQLDELPMPGNGNVGVPLLAGDGNRHAVAGQYDEEAYGGLNRNAHPSAGGRPPQQKYYYGMEQEYGN